MHPPLWHPPIELSAAEQVIVSRIRRAKLFIFLRLIRHRRSCRVLVSSTSPR
ncbi:MAG: hypothetical protein RID53_01725 [Coleofasciculus sp. B1-GNL1-01]|uniref:hypothetical protein n=1 Tax=Coleofasciculus sp. B1-GNL1-01 TaxID=3068484 RepID=UPI003301845D